MLQTADLAALILERWHSASRLTQDAYRRIGQIASACADELGPELPDTAITHSLITAWLKAQDDIEAKEWAWEEPKMYLGEPGL